MKSSRLVLSPHEPLVDRAAELFERQLQAALAAGRRQLALMKLLVATGIGLLVTAVHRPTLRERPMNRSMEHAQTLLCVSGAMVMIIIGNSIARAFGIAGAATIIRFRTPVDDPKD